jgi:hypothetical protein
MIRKDQLQLLKENSLNYYIKVSKSIIYGRKTILIIKINIFNSNKYNSIHNKLFYFFIYVVKKKEKLIINQYILKSNIPFKNKYPSFQSINQWFFMALFLLLIY